MGNDKFESFLLAEYDHIADAHFETGKQVSKFFNYYLLILAAPVIIVTLIQNKKLDSIINPLQDKDVMYLHWIIFFILLIISLFGLALCWIVVELQHDSIVYARTVNGIRNYFYSEAQLKQEDENKTRVLPKDVKQPGFYSYRHLGIIVGAFSLVNTSFAIAACYIIEMGSLSKWSIVGLVAFCLLHFIIHFALSLKRTRKYA